MIIRALLNHAVPGITQNYLPGGAGRGQDQGARRLGRQAGQDRQPQAGRLMRNSEKKIIQKDPRESIPEQLLPDAADLRDSLLALLCIHIMSYPELSAGPRMVGQNGRPFVQLLDEHAPRKRGTPKGPYANVGFYVQSMIDQKIKTQRDARKHYAAMFGLTSAQVRPAAPRLSARGRPKVIFPELFCCREPKYAGIYRSPQIPGGDYDHDGVIEARGAIQKTRSDRRGEKRPTPKLATRTVSTRTVPATRMVPAKAPPIPRTTKITTMTICSG